MLLINVVLCLFSCCVCVVISNYSCFIVLGAACGGMRVRARVRAMRVRAARVHAGAYSDSHSTLACMHACMLHACMCTTCVCATCMCAYTSNSNATIH